MAAHLSSALLCPLDGEQLELLLELQGEIAGDEVHQHVGGLGGLDGRHGLGGHALGDLVVLGELGEHGAHQGGDRRRELGASARGRTTTRKQSFVSV